MNAIKWLPLAVLLLLPLTLAHAFDTNAVQSAVSAVIVQQEKDWNAGDIEKFMRGYLRSEQTRFATSCRSAPKG